MLYHFEIGFPKKMQFRAVLGLVPSFHALRESNSDRYGKFEIPSSFNPETDKVIEIEVENGALNKIVARRPIDAARDVVFVFLPRTKVIKTVWINENSDKHATLNRSLYAKP